jgi:DNA processing protein
MMNSTSFSPVLPFREVVAYESLWAAESTSFKSLAELFAKHPNAKPTDIVDASKISALYTIIKGLILNADRKHKTNLIINGMYDYPFGLRDARHPVELLYYNGRIDFLRTRCISLAGTSKPTLRSLELVKQLTTQLVADDFTIVSGLATGIDTQAHFAAIAGNGRTIGVIGTPLNAAFPLQNENLQDILAIKHLLISQVPFFRYAQQSPESNRQFFIERYKTISAISEATLIIEAKDNSLALTQARAALYQGRKLMIWDTCFRNPELSWPERFVESGAIRVGSYAAIREVLSKEQVSVNY